MGTGVGIITFAIVESAQVPCPIIDELTGVGGT